MSQSSWNTGAAQSPEDEGEGVLNQPGVDTHPAVPEAEHDADVEPARALWGLRLNREARFGLAALLSFFVLVAVMVIKRESRPVNPAADAGEGKLPPIASITPIEKTPQPEPNPAAPGPAPAPAPTVTKATAQETPAAAPEPVLLVMGETVKVDDKAPRPAERVDAPAPATQTDPVESRPELPADATPRPTPVEAPAAEAPLTKQAEAPAPVEPAPASAPEPTPQPAATPAELQGPTSAEPTSPAPSSGGGLALPSDPVPVTAPSVDTPTPNPTPVPSAEPAPFVATPIPASSAVSGGVALPNASAVDASPAQAAPIPASAPPLEPTPPPSSAAPGPVLTPSPSPPSLGDSGNWVALPTAGKGRTIEIDDDRNRPGPSALAEPAHRAREPKAMAMPAAVAEPAGVDRGEPGQVEPVPHVVQKGENFFSISQLYYGSGRFYKALWAANRAVVPAEDQLYVNQTIRIPPPESLDRSLILPPRPAGGGGQGGPSSSRPSPTSGSTSTSIPTRSTDRAEVDLPTSDPFTRRSLDGRDGPDPEPAPDVRPRRSRYKVRPHETLRSIARDALGDSHRAGEILELNAGVIDDPRQLIPGQILELPGDARPVRERPL